MERTSRIFVDDPIFTTRVTIRNPFFASTGHAYETTVEVTYVCTEDELDEVAAVAREHMTDQLQKAALDGRREANARNATKE